MSELLTNDQVAALVEAAQQGELPDDRAGGSGASPSRRSRRLRSVDFARPTKFTSEHERRIVRALDAFCTTAATRLSAELRVPLELEVIDTTQLPWSSAQSALPPDSVGAALAVAPVGTRMLLTAELPLVLLTIEHLLGGGPERPPKARKLSEIDWALTRRLFDMLTHHLSLVWQDLAGLTLETRDVDTHMEGLQVTAVSDPTLTLTFEARVDRHSSTLALLVPWSAIDGVADELAGRETRNEATDPRIAAAVRRAVAGAEVVLRAEVAHVEMAIDEVLALEPGDLVRLGAPATAGVGIYAEDVPIHRAQPGRSGTRRAVQVTAPAGGGA
ncbi:MAG TPA: FliM/FliN family flagellar motor switch protein [Conexibacter sp.]|jgi:flagellar motor switch protein FliM|nr:FliM/FliN family flagellar motor switch protein [Conexibacter sp.]